METVTFNVVAFQEASGEVRIDRFIPKKIGGKEAKETKENYERRATPHFMNMSDEKILAVVGATGAQGGGLVRAITSDPSGGFAVRAITRAWITC